MELSGKRRHNKKAMQKINYVVRIPEPCHEDWNTMKPDEKGKFCKVCSKSVIDFSNKSDAEVHNILHENKDKKVCGHFKTTQVNRPLKYTVPIQQLPSSLSPTKAFAIALFFVFGTLLFSCTDNNGKEINKIELTPDEQYSVGITMIDLPIQPSQSDTIVLDTATETLTTSCSSISGDISVLDEVTVEDSVTNLHSFSIVGGAIAIDVIRHDSYTTFTDSTTVQQDEKRKAPDNTVKDFSFAVYPNPTDGNTNISYEVLKKGMVQVSIYDINGELVLSPVNTQEQYEGRYILPTDLSKLPNGVYICTILNNGQVKSTKFVLSR